MSPKKPRKGKPLLLATVGLATVSFVACNDPKPTELTAIEPKPEQAVDNARPVETAPPVANPTPPPAEDTSARDAGTGAPDAGADDAGVDAGDAGRDAGGAGLKVKPPGPGPRHPVGNLRAPMPLEPVGNLRAPTSH